MRKYYRYLVTMPLLINTGIGGYEFENKWGKLTRDGYLTIKSRYAFNGASPKINFWDIFVIGTPDGIKDYRTGQIMMFDAYACHDYLCQFRRDIGITIDECSDAFLNVGLQCGFRSIGLYYFAVRVFWFIPSLIEKARK